MTRLRKILFCVFLAGSGLGAFPFTEKAVSACPSCKAANESDQRRPRAYMYSILFMLAMPATVFTGFGISFYRLSRRAEAESAAAVEDREQLANSEDSGRE